MNYLITPIIEIPEDELPDSPAELTRIVSQLSTMFHEVEIRDKATFTLTKASLHERVVENYSASITAKYTHDGDLWVVTPDGGHLNADKFVRDIRTAVEHAWL